MSSHHRDVIILQINVISILIDVISIQRCHLYTTDKWHLNTEMSSHHRDAISILRDVITLLRCHYKLYLTNAIRVNFEFSHSLCSTGQCGVLYSTVISPLEYLHKRSVSSAQASRVKGQDWVPTVQYGVLYSTANSAVV